MKTLTLTEFDITLLQGALEHLQEQLLIDRDPFAVDLDDARVRAALANTVLLQADVTANDADDQALLRRFGIFGPPTIAFYGPDGVERARYRVVGFMPAPEFADVVTRATAR